MRTLVQVLFAFVIALALLIGLVMALPIQLIKMLAGNQGQAADHDARRKAEPVQH
ncbi:MAG: hypothetical protein JWM63_268 [Gammaproteobacteria bacterium]|jgi:hypothetical protein|nr:hypothetical protein [Gammaproteobacteria bacterium]